MKYLLIAIVLIIIGVGAYFVLGGPAEAPLTQSTETETPAPEVQTGEAATVTVAYTAQGFSPSTVTVRVGDTVRFVNQTDLEMWVGSDEHPDHTDYAGTTRKDHCPDAAGTAFDQCAVGNSYSFTFTKAGTWGYHNHRIEEDTGTVIVE